MKICPHLWPQLLKLQSMLIVGREGPAVIIVIGMHTPLSLTVEILTLTQFARSLAIVCCMCRSCSQVNFFQAVMMPFGIAHMGGMCSVAFVYIWAGAKTVYMLICVKRMVCVVFYLGPRIDDDKLVLLI